MKKIAFCLLLSSSVIFPALSQDDLSKLLEQESKKEEQNKTEFTQATFKTTRLINGHSVENTGAGVLDVKISHRFGTLNRGAYEFFGLDNASMRMGLDYGITPTLMVGIGRSTFQKQYDGFFKLKLLRQSTGKRKMPITLSWLSSLMIQTLKDNPNSTEKTSFDHRVYYAHQVLIGRKFSEGFSLQLMPTLVHYNLTPSDASHNDIWAIGIGGRQKLTKRTSINIEYYYVPDEYKLPGTYNSLSVGFDIETGGHVFQLHFTNSTGMTERTFITETDGRWNKGDIHFGFNIARVFTIKKPKPK